MRFMKHREFVFSVVYKLHYFNLPTFWNELITEKTTSSYKTLFQFLQV